MNKLSKKLSDILYELCEAGYEAKDQGKSILKALDAIEIILAKERSSAIRETVEEIKKDLGRIFEERHNEAINILMIKNYLNSLKEKQP